MNDSYNFCTVVNIKFFYKYLPHLNIVHIRDGKNAELRHSAAAGRFGHGQADGTSAKHSANVLC